MPAASLLSDAEIAERLRAHPAWDRRGRAIARELAFAGFREAVEFVARLAPDADRQNHHPDVEIHWNRLTLTLWTHASGGLTERDFRLAAAIDALVPSEG